MHNILVVEDAPAVRAALVHALQERGYAVSPVDTAVDALRFVATRKTDLVILDLGLPDLDGAAVLRMLRGMSNVPVIIVTARGGERSVIDLLNAGADDYVVKPFSSDHLVARISALLRRVKAGDDDGDVLEIGDLQIERRQRVVRLAGCVVDLNRREFDLLTYLAARPDTVVTRQELIRDVWQQRLVGEDRTIDVHLSWLRRKLGETAANPRYLHTVRGVGLKLSAPK